jgi:hypothetical protein
MKDRDEAETASEWLTSEGALCVTTPERRSLGVEEGAAPAIVGSSSDENGVIECELRKTKRENVIRLEWLVVTSMDAVGK